MLALQLCNARLLGGMRREEAIEEKKRLKRKREMEKMKEGKSETETAGDR